MQTIGTLTLTFGSAGCGVLDMLLGTVTQWPPSPLSHVKRETFFQAHTTLYMPGKCGAVEKATVAGSALEGPGARVQAAVDCQMDLLAELFLAVRALVRP